MRLICGRHGICPASGLPGMPTMRCFTARANGGRSMCLIACGSGSTPASSNCTRARHGLCTFRPRKALDKYGRVYVNFSPAVSRDALKAMLQTIRGWHLQLKSDKNLDDLSAMFAPILKGWQQYYGRFHGSALKPVWRHMNLFLIRWLMRKHKGLTGHKTRGCRDTEATGAKAAGCVHSLVHGLSVIGWMMRAG